MNLAFLHPGLLLLLPLALLPLLPRRHAALPCSSLAPLQSLRPSWRTLLSRLQPLLAVLTLLLLILALAGPVVRERLRETVREGVDLMLALDVSASLAARDVPPDRISAARNAAADFLEQRRDDRVGVILFAGVPTLLAPPVLDKGPVVARLRRIEVDPSGSGTALGDGLAAALDRLKDSPAKSRAVILLTDGSSNRGRIAPLAAARAAASLGIRVYTIGFGNDRGAEIPFGPQGAPARSSDGSLVRGSLEEGPLREIARLSGGRYFHADSDRALREVYRQIDGLEKSPLEIRERVAETALSQKLFAAAALLLLLEILLFRLWLRRLP
jgi:Ca-activated chloride channel family protein